MSKSKSSKSDSDDDQTSDSSKKAKATEKSSANGKKDEDVKMDGVGDGDGGDAKKPLPTSTASTSSAASTSSNLAIPTHTISGYAIYTAYNSLYRALIDHNTDDALFWCPQLVTVYGTAHVFENLTLFTQIYCSLTIPDLIQKFYSVQDIFYKKPEDPKAEETLAGLVQLLAKAPKSRFVEDVMYVAQLLSCAAPSFLPQSTKVSDEFAKLTFVTKLKSDLSCDEGDRQILFDSYMPLMEWWHMTMKSVVDQSLGLKKTKFKPLNEVKLVWTDILKQIHTSAEWKEGNDLLENTELKLLVCGTIIFRLSRYLQRELGQWFLSHFMWKSVCGLIRSAISVMKEESEKKQAEILLQHVRNNLTGFNKGSVVVKSYEKNKSPACGDPYRSWICALLLISRHPSTAPQHDNIPLPKLTQDLLVSTGWEDILSLTDEESGTSAMCVCVRCVFV
jgi:hypothetical protein